MNAGETVTSRINKDNPRVIDRRTSTSSLSDALVLVDKPSGCTSFDVVKMLRRLTGIRKIGHAGTLDPMASGLLICMIGRATKSMSTLVDLDKEYIGTVRLGASTPSYDSETPVVDEVDVSHISLEDVQLAAATYTGTIIQKTPPYSAVRVGGEPLYKKARRGEKTQTPPRVVSVHEFRIVELDSGKAEFFVRCSKGTYIRSLAHDVGQTLGVGGHLTSLRRVSIGPYRVDDALTPDAVAALVVTVPSKSATHE